MSVTEGFISFEGIEGTGKTTQAKLLADYLGERGYDVLTTEEPGGTDIGIRIRNLLLDPLSRMDPLTELFLYSASRNQLIKEVIEPALKGGKIVITDRFTDSTLAYQGYARGVDLRIIQVINNIATHTLKPSLTILLDVEVEKGLERNRRINKDDRFEMETIKFHRRVREGYLKLLEEEPERIRLIDASGSIEEVHREIVKVVEEARVIPVR